MRTVALHLHVGVGDRPCLTCPTESSRQQSFPRRCGMTLALSFKDPSGTGVMTVRSRPWMCQRMKSLRETMGSPYRRKCQLMSGCCEIGPPQRLPRCKLPPKLLQWASLVPSKCGSEYHVGAIIPELRAEHGPVVVSSTKPKRPSQPRFRPPHTTRLETRERRVASYCTMSLSSMAQLLASPVTAPNRVHR
ncbi:hypothetical protein BAUCODRAFT_410645 [Baudoinia panamericana UAMH 10762]|uniref:Uncharacterized protein n=1 Tax=Baudoinia panamericana (strain UAMH 10762) TaxID=717646 RepID=M2N278_BAUPA|nr:uncharacterized protein BAUCODRAFT_410645 [Baudoinia panamericana UAMH 10762]EMC98008.1 hypothetical protein BAUCODRAFT_410645 [Baudoinia panamericana UAMH 10762]